MAVDDILALFTGIGLSEQKAKETIKNESLSKNLQTVIADAKKGGNLDKDDGKLLYHVATKLKAQIRQHQGLIVRYIAEKKIKSETQLNAAMEFLLHNPMEPVDMGRFEEEAGVGVVISPDQVEEAVEESIKKHKDELVEKRYKFNTGTIMGEARLKLKWADGKCIKNEIDMQILHLLGPKTEADTAKVPKTKATKSEKPAKKELNEKIEETDASENILNTSGEVKSFMDLVGDSVKFHKPGENYKTDGYVITPQTMDLMKQHLTETEGKVMTRFPPEPNGILHIGHAKAINFNFGYAKANDGMCYLRYDDTNPEKEEEKFFRGIQEMVQWLGQQQQYAQLQQYPGQNHQYPQQQPYPQQQYYTSQQQDAHPTQSLNITTVDQRRTSSDSVTFTNSGTSSRENSFNLSVLVSDTVAMSDTSFERVVATLGDDKE